MLLVALVLLLAPPASAAWSWPADGPVVERFTYDAAAPFERGARRGIVIGAARGSPVRAPCDGRVRFAGTAGANGRTVTVACGRYSTTYRALSSIAVREGARVRERARLGRAGGDGVRFGVRRRSDRLGYVDPLVFLPPRRGPGGTPVLGRAPRAAPLRPPSPLAGPVHARPLTSPDRSPPTTLPLVAWVGLAAAACGVVGAPLLGVRRRRRHHQTVAATLRSTWTRRWKSST